MSISANARRAVLAGCFVALIVIAFRAGIAPTADRPRHRSFRCAAEAQAWIQFRAQHVVEVADDAIDEWRARGGDRVSGCGDSP